MNGLSLLCALLAVQVGHLGKMDSSIGTQKAGQMFQSIHDAKKGLYLYSGAD